MERTRCDWCDRKAVREIETIYGPGHPACEACAPKYEVREVHKRKRTPEAKRPRVVIFGSRDFWDPRLAYKTLDAALAKLEDPIVVSGCAKGADALGEMWARKHGYLVKRFEPDWETHGKKAGPIRNAEMAAYANERRPAFAVAFWDGVSRGTADMIARCKRLGFRMRIVEYKKKSLLS